MHLAQTAPDRELSQLVNLGRVGWLSLNCWLMWSIRIAGLATTVKLGNLTQLALLFTQSRFLRSVLWCLFWSYGSG